MKIKLAVSLLCVQLCLAGCTWVKPTEGAESVALVKPAVVMSCKSLAKTTVSVKDKVGFINRGAEKVATELLTLAKNAALNNGGDTLVSDGPETDGVQTFSVYKCRP